jgi:hypothetical protein
MTFKFYTNKTASKFLLFFTATFLLFSCQKAIENIEPPVVVQVLPDLITKVNSSVSGFVTDENEAVVRNATVLVGTSTTTTDKYGYFEAKNVQMVQNAAVVTVTKAGYFKGIKTYIATANKAAFFRIKLMPKINTGTVNGATGGIVTLPNGLSFSFPVGAIVNATTNAAYSGTVNVAAFYINPTANDINRIMPGDLRGINATGNLQLLTSFGMAAVELTGAGGELLQIATGKKVKLSTPIPSTLVAGAPNTIPLWYFDEAKGLWKEEGIATKNGNNYVGEVSHFSFWNCDVPNNYVQFNCTVVSTSGIPLQNIPVKISLVNNPSNAAYGYTDANGYVSGAVPDNAQLKIELFSSYYCSSVIFSQTFTTTSSNLNFGNLTVNNNNNLATVSGNVTNCAGTAVSNGFIILQNGNQFAKYALSNTGTYSFIYTLCGGTTASINLIGEDITTVQQGNTSVNLISAGNNVIPTIQACGNSIQEFINYSVNGTLYSNTIPTSSFYHSSIGTNQTAVNGTNNGNAYQFINFSTPNIAIGSSQNLLGFSASPVLDSSISIQTQILVNITEYGTIGQFISGNFNGLLNGPPPANIPYNVNCSFRVRRTF